MNSTKSGPDGFNRALLGKYNTELYSMYVEYPHKSLWSSCGDDANYRKTLRELLKGERRVPILLYVHIPFCPRLCYFCSCHTYATKDYGRVRRYLDLLFKEMELLAGFLAEHNLRPDVREIHLGGGSPTMLLPEDFDRLLRRLGNLADMRHLDELAMEIDPRYVSRDHLLYYRDRGVNRISFGVQDFDPDVQEAVGRVQPPELLEKLLTPDIRQLFSSINFDVMWGLPRQTRKTFRETIETVLRFSPDRISLLLLHYAPEVKKNQQMMKASQFPGHEERTALFLDAVRTLTEEGYVRVGFDHFAKPTDAVAAALKNGEICWNSLGYTPGRYVDVLGIGTGSSSRLTNHYYSQNVYDQKVYEESLENGRFPLLREYELTSDDVVRRDIMHRLRSYFRVDRQEIEDRHGISFNGTFAPELESLRPFIEDGLIADDGRSIEMTEQGKLFTTLVCRVFDKYARQNDPGAGILRAGLR